MQRSFSIVHDDTLDVEDEDDKDELEQFKFKADLSVSGSEELSASPKKANQLQNKVPDALQRKRLLSADPSSSKTSLKSSERNINSSDSEDSEKDDKTKKFPGEYDPKQFESLDVDEEVQEVFQYILKYTPQHIATDYKFKPFIPEFLPAVGDVDAFLKVVPPETTLSGEIFDENILQLGLLVLDEPAANQSEPALLHLQLRAANDSVVISGKEEKNIVVKKIDNVEKQSKVIDKWIKDISHLHKSKSSPIVRYSQPMPDLDDLMQQWPEDIEQKLKQEGFPKHIEDQPLSDYVDTVCNYLQIPIAKNKTQAAAVSRDKAQDIEEKTSGMDQLVLE